jgi:hypothetical protein
MLQGNHAIVKFLKIFSFYLFPPLAKTKSLPISAFVQRLTQVNSLLAGRRYPGDWENQMNSKFIAAVAVTVALTMPAMAGVKCAVSSTSHAACTSTTPPHGTLAHSTQGATVSHGGSAIAKKPH